MGISEAFRYFQIFLFCPQIVNLLFFDSIGELTSVAVRESFDTFFRGQLKTELFQHFRQFLFLCAGSTSEKNHS